MPHKRPVFVCGIQQSFFFKDRQNLHTLDGKNMLVSLLAVPLCQYTGSVKMMNRS